jgi:hypothetical protein
MKAMKIKHKVALGIVALLTIIVAVKKTKEFLAAEA